MTRKTLPNPDPERLPNPEHQDISLATQELAYMIVNKIFSNPELVEKLISIVTNWLQENLTQRHLSQLLRSDSGIIEDYNNLLTSALNMIDNMSQKLEK